MLLIYGYSRPTRCQRIISAWSIRSSCSMFVNSYPRVSLTGNGWSGARVETNCGTFPIVGLAFRLTKNTRSTVYWRLDYLKDKGIHSIHEDVHQNSSKTIRHSILTLDALQEYIFYPAPKITVALLRGSLADEAGNISFERVAWL